MYKYSKMLYNKKNLREYCLENKYDYDSILSRLKYIFYTNKFSKLTTKAKIELAIERYKNRDNYKYANYIYEGEKLRDYCDHKNISRKFIYSRLRYYDKSVNKKNLPMIIKIQLAINSYNNPKNFKYSNITYKNKNLLEYCKENTIRFEAIRYRIYYARKKGEFKDFPSEEKISLYIEKYHKSEYIKKIKNLMKKLENENLKNSDYRLITKELGINYKKLIRLVNTSIDIKTLIILTWYCSDLSDENGIYISKNKLNKLKNKENLDICDLIGLFKSGNKEILTNIIEFEKFYIMGIIKKEINKYNLIINKYQYKEIIEDITFELINILNNIVLRYPGQIVNYIRISLMYKTLNYIIENIFNKSLTYMDEIGSKKNIKEFWDIDL